MERYGGREIWRKREGEKRVRETRVRKSKKERKIIDRIQYMQSGREIESRHQPKISELNRQLD